MYRARELRAKQRRHQKQFQKKEQKQQKFHRKLFGFSLFIFLMGFFLGRVVLAAEYQLEWEDISQGITEEKVDTGERDSDARNGGVEGTREDEVIGTEKGEEKTTSWNLILVNHEHSLPSDYSVELSEVGDGHQVDSRIAQALRDMIAAGKADGYGIWIVSSYRTMEKQTDLYQKKVAQFCRQGYSESEAKRLAGAMVAVPGTSEHQLGLAVDLVSSQYTKLDEGQEQTGSYQWLVKHCAEYGFILRYPNDKTEETGIIYEPWHFRYVGRDAAKEIMDQGICLEEYLEQKAREKGT